MTLPKRPGFYSVPKASEYGYTMDSTPDASQAWFHKFIITGELGHGAFGKVFQAILEPQGVLCAVKQIPILSGERGAAVMHEAVREIEVMTMIRHPNIVKMIGYAKTPEHFNIFMQLVTGNSLDSIKKARRNSLQPPLSESIVCSYIKQTLNGLIYCHRKNIIHRDLKGKNILLDSGGVIKIADFGSSKICDYGQQQADLTRSHTFNYTVLWVAPEVVGNKGYNMKCDVWSLGCVAIELASGEDPWAERKFTSILEVIKELTQTDNLPEMRAGMSDEYYAFVRSCLTRDVEKRPSAEELWGHPWLSKWEVDEELRLLPVGALGSGTGAASSASSSSSSSSSSSASPAKRQLFGALGQQQDNSNAAKTAGGGPIVPFDNGIASGSDYDNDSGDDRPKPVAVPVYSSSVDDDHKQPARDQNTANGKRKGNPDSDLNFLWQPLPLQRQKQQQQPPLFTPGNTLPAPTFALPSLLSQSPRRAPLPAAADFDDDDVDFSVIEKSNYKEDGDTVVMPMPMQQRADGGHGSGTVAIANATANSNASTIAVPRNASATIAASAASAAGDTDFEGYTRIEIRPSTPPPLRSRQSLHVHSPPQSPHSPRIPQSPHTPRHLPPLPESPVKQELSPSQRQQLAQLHQSPLRLSQFQSQQPQPQPRHSSPPRRSSLPPLPSSDGSPVSAKLARNGSGSGAVTSMTPPRPMLPRNPSLPTSGSPSSPPMHTLANGGAFASPPRSSKAMGGVNLFGNLHDIHNPPRPSSSFSSSSPNRPHSSVDAAALPNAREPYELSSRADVSSSRFFAQAWQNAEPIAAAPTTPSLLATGPNRKHHNAAAGVANGSGSGGDSGEPGPAKFRRLSPPHMAPSSAVPMPQAIAQGVSTAPIPAALGGDGRGSYVIFDSSDDVTEVVQGGAQPSITVISNSKATGGQGHQISHHPLPRRQTSPPPPYTFASIGAPVHAPASSLAGGSCCRVCSGFGCACWRLGATAAIVISAATELTASSPASPRHRLAHAQPIQETPVSSIVGQNPNASASVALVTQSPYAATAAGNRKNAPPSAHLAGAAAVVINRNGNGNGNSPGPRFSMPPTEASAISVRAVASINANAQNQAQAQSVVVQRNLYISFKILFL